MGRNPATHLYSDTTKHEYIFDKQYQKNVKITKLSHAFKGYASLFNFEILRSFNPDLELQDTESTIKKNLIVSLTELNGFNFLTTLV